MTLRSALLSALIVIGGLPASVLAAQVTLSSTIDKLQTYPGNTNWLYADSSFTLVGASTSLCTGFWLRASDPGYQNAYAMLVAAKMTKQAITVTARDDVQWGASSNTCLVYSIEWQ